MTENEWLECTDPFPMLEFLRGKPSERKLRLFACGCCRGVLHLIKDKGCKTALEIIERYADGLVSQVELFQAAELADKVQAETARGAYEAGERRGDFLTAEPLYQESWAADAIQSAG